MKLDKRITEDYKIYTCFDAEQAKEYINTEGYFTDYYDNFRDVGKLFYGTCLDVDDVSEFPYRHSYSEHKENYKFFLPEKFVKKEKKLRAYKNISEFCNNTGCKIVGSHCIHIRIKNTERDELLLYTGFDFGNNAAHLGGHVLTLETLFYNYEFLRKGDWLPFGVEDEL